MVAVEGRELVVSIDGGVRRLPLIAAPPAFTEWMDSGRRTMYEQLLEGSMPVHFFSQHLPMVVSYNRDATFPFNCGNKGVGYLPRPEHLERYVARYRSVLAESEGRPWRDSLRARVQTVAGFNVDTEAIDRRCLATLEIFERQTFSNLKKTPLAGLLFTGHSPAFKSFQLNCAVEVIGPGDPRHTFVTLARTMFEYDEFHITQKSFPFAYVFWISECIEKTPFRVARPSVAPAEAEPGALPWEPAALEAVSGAPQRIQGFVRSTVEDYARRRGFSRVTLLVLQEARANLMDGR